MKTVKISDRQTSLPIKIFNIFVPKQKINLDKILEKAKSTTKLSNFGDEGFIEAAQVLAKDINQNANLTPFGSFFTKTMLLKSAVNLLEIQNETKGVNVELEKPPIIIFGLPRTGSTLFFNLMASDPNFRTLNFWESLRFSKNFPRLLKKIKGKAQLESTNWFAPQLRAIHEIRYQGPGECTQILTNSFKNISFGCYWQLPEYNPWVLKESQVETYQLHKKQLFLLDPKKQWVLKSPMHIVALKDIKKVYPDSKIIHLHRDPVSVVGSASSLIAASRNLFTHNTVLKPTGDDISMVLKWSLEKTIDERQELPKDDFIDIYFNDLVKDSIGTFKKLYQDLCLEWTDTLEQIYQNELKNNKRHKYGKHIYDLADYDLSEDLIRDKYKKYIEHFKI